MRKITEIQNLKNLFVALSYTLENGYVDYRRLLLTLIKTLFTKCFVTPNFLLKYRFFKVYFGPTKFIKFKIENINM